jgi:N-acetyl-anhydromuramyl-L-alanine amidase AmpD
MRFVPTKAVPRLALAIGLATGALVPTFASPGGAPAISQKPAYSGNYMHNGPRTIDMIVIHKADGSAQSCYNWFQSPQAKVSAHYVVDDGGNVFQMVPDQNIAYHCGNSPYNRRSIGIENGGWTHKNDISDIHLRGLAKLTRWLCDKYRIPKDRSHIIGHDEVPDPGHPGRFGGRNNHDDPGEFFNWPLFMKYVLGDDPDPQDTPTSTNGLASRVEATAGDQPATAASAGATAVPSDGGDPSNAIDRAPATSNLGSLGDEGESAAAPPAHDPPPQILVKGEANDAVKTVQQMLVKCGYRLKVDGNFGPATAAAVRSFQHSHGLKVDGIVGPLTWRALKTAISDR